MAINAGDTVLVLHTVGPAGVHASGRAVEAASRLYAHAHARRW
jgi:hypothetical protein